MRKKHLNSNKTVPMTYFAEALESLGVNWGKTFPVPKTDSSKMPEVQALEKETYTISNGHSQMTSLD